MVSVRRGFSNDFSAGSMTMYQAFGKRLFDVVGLIFILLSPLFLVVSLAILLFDPDRPIFPSTYRQEWSPFSFL